MILALRKDSYLIRKDYYRSDTKGVALALHSRVTLCCCVCKKELKISAVKEDNQNGTDIIFKDEIVLVDNTYYIVVPTGYGKPHVNCRALFDMCPMNYVETTAI